IFARSYGYNILYAWYSFTFYNICHWFSRCVNFDIDRDFSFFINQIVDGFHNFHFGFLFGLQTWVGNGNVHNHFISKSNHVFYSTAFYHILSFARRRDGFKGFIYILFVQFHWSLNRKISNVQIYLLKMEVGSLAFEVFYGWIEEFYDGFL